MKRSFHETKETVDARLSERVYMRDGDGRIIVTMTVKNDNDFLSVFSESDTPIISTAVADFIEGCTQSIRPKEQLTLQVRSNCIDDQEKTIYEKAIREYYIERYISNERELTRSNRVAFVLAIIGILLLVLAVLLNHILIGVVWAEVVDIVAWVFLWEAVDIRAFGNRAMKQKRVRYLSYISMKIEFFPDQNS